MTAVKPESGSALHGYWGSDGSQHVNFIGVDFHLHELYIAPNTAGWTDNDLTQLAAGQLAGVGPALNTALAGYWGSEQPACPLFGRRHRIQPRPRALHHPGQRLGQQ
jgi:hypothetical protein